MAGAVHKTVMIAGQIKGGGLCSAKCTVQFF